MKTSALLFLVLSAMCILNGCATTTDTTDKPTIIRGSPAEARENLFELHNKTVRNLAY